MNWTMIPQLAMLSLLTVVGCAKGGETDDTTVDTDDTNVQVDDEICDDNEDNDGDGDVDCDDRDCRNEDACAEPEYTEAYAVGVSGAFAYNADLDVAQGAQLADGTPLPISVYVTIYDEAAWTGAAGGITCTYVVSLEQAATLPMTTWEVDGASQSGVVVPSEDATITAAPDCDDALFDESVWGPDMGANVAAWNWGVGIGEMHKDVDAQFDKYVADGDLTAEARANFLGGGSWIELIGGTADDKGYSPTLYGFGFAMDESFTIIEVEDADGDGNPDNVPLLYSDVANETGVPPTGFYSVRVFNGYIADILLPQ